MSAHADRDRGRRPRRAVPLDPVEAAGPVARGRRLRAQRARRHVRLRRRVLRRDAGRVRGRRPGVLRGDHAPVRALERDRRPLPRRGDHVRRARLLRARPQGAARTSSSGARPTLGVELHFRTEVSDARRRPRRGRRRRQQHAARPLRRALRAVARPAPGDVRVVRHRPRLRGLHVHHRRDAAGRRAGPRVSVQRHAQHVHRRDDRARGSTRTRARSCSAIG